MKVILSAEIAVERVAVFAEMAWLERRPELGLLCRTARGSRISPAVVQAVVPGLGDAGARNVLSWCRMLGLCDAQGSLTTLGEDVAENNTAPVPEQGVYGFWLAQHPVLGQRILSVERLAARHDSRFDDITALPIVPDRGVVFRSVVDPQQRYLLRELPNNHGQPGGVRGTTNASCRLRWTLDFTTGHDQWQLDGVIEAPQGDLRSIQHTPEIDGLDLKNLANIWGAGALAAFGHWQVVERRLAVPLKGLTDNEQDDFRKTFKLRQLEVPGKGSYADVSLEDVPIGPFSKEEAQRWAMSRLSRQLLRQPAYRSRSEVRRLFAELVEASPLETFGPSLPAHDMLIGGSLHTKTPEVFWSLAAPVDLAPRAVPVDELKALQIGVAASEVPTEEPKVLRVPYRGGWSMQRLSDRLIGEGTPRRVLLCDRYVRGAENLASLKLLVQSLRQRSPALLIEVWTDEEEADFKQLRALTGSAPRSYREMFGRSAPHDRYFLVVPEHGDGFGWQLSNSPLDARADIPDAAPATPLRSRGLIAARMAAEELPQQLGQWLHGVGR